MPIKRRARVPRVPQPLQSGQIRIKASTDGVRWHAQLIRRMAIVSNKFGGGRGGLDGTGCFQLSDFRYDGCLHDAVGEAAVRGVFDVFDPGDAGWVDAE